ncbi:truncated transposase [Escherichia coli]|nr:truncated transposase [Escherichia coli]
MISRGRDSTHVLDGLLYHESDLEITEHYTDTAGFTEHVFALMHLLGFAFAPRIRDLHDKRLFIHGKAERYPEHQSVISTTSLNIKDIETYWDEVLRLAASIKQGTVTALLMMKKLVLDIYPSLSLILRYIYCLVFHGASSDSFSNGLLPVRYSKIFLKESIWLFII